MVGPFFYAKNNITENKMLLHCNECGYETEVENEEEAFENNWWRDEEGEWYCEDCHERCQYCDDEFPRSQVEYSEIEEGYICECCAEEHCDRCRNCGNLTNTENSIRVYKLDDATIVTFCRGCYERLRENGEIYDSSDCDYPVYNPNNRTNSLGIQMNYNPDVWQEVRTCEDCRGNMERCPRCLRKIADAQEEEEVNLWIYDTHARQYHFGMHDHFKETKYREKHEHPRLYYGIELEVLFNSSTNIDTITQEYIKATKGLFVAEYDRSVTNAGNGIEFISRPLSFKKWSSQEVYQLLEEGKKVLEKYNAYSPQPEICGLHVHMSLPFFERNTTKSVEKIKSDIDWMFQIYQEEIEKISRRKYTKYCASKAYRLKRLMNDLRYNNYGFNLNPQVSIGKGEITRSCGSGDTHHDAIIQTYKTIEVRTFRSTISTEEILATIEFCRCVAHAARNKDLTEKNVLGDILWCKDSKYLPMLIKNTKIDTEKKFKNKLEVKI